MRPLTAKIVDRSVILAATFILVAQQYSFPSRSFWIHTLGGSEYIVAFLVTTIAAFGALTPAQAWSERSQVVHRTAIRQQILNHFGRLLAMASHIEPRPSSSDLGLHVWRIRWSIHKPHHRLVRIATYRLGSSPATRPFEPGRGVGVVGLCWKRNEEVAIDVAELATQLTTEEKYEAFRASKGAEEVMNLDWQQFVRVRHRGAVFASPIRDGQGDVIGCVSVDTSHGFATLATDELWHEINSLCLLLGNDGMANV